MWKTCIAFATAISVLTSMPTVAQAQGVWNKKYMAPGTLGQRLEGDFGKLLQVCGASVLDRRHTDYSSIPTSLQAALRDQLPQRVTVFEGPSSATLFRYVFETRDLRTYEAADPSKRLPDGFVQMSNVPTPVQGYSSRIYSQTCASIVAAAVSVNLNPPILSIQGALNSQYKGNNNIALVSGLFYSPLYALLAEGGTTPERLQALLGLWQYYRANQALVGKPVYYLSGFNGLAAFYLSGRSLSQEYDVKASASGNWLIGSMDAKVGVNATSESTLTVNDYVTVAYRKADGADNVSFAQVPTPHEIADEFATRTAVFKPVAEEYVRQNAIFRHTFSVTGIPPAMCSQALWNISTAPPEIGYDDARYEEGACRFYAHYNAPADLKNVPSSIAYRISYAQTVGADTLHLNVSFQPSTTTHPITNISDFEKRPTTITSAANDRTLRWSIPIRFIDDMDAVRFDLRPASISSPTVSCGGSTELVTAVVAQDPQARSGVIVTVERRLGRTEVTDSARDKERECNFGAVLTLPLAGMPGVPARNATRAVNATLVLPPISIPPSTPTLQRLDTVQ